MEGVLLSVLVVLSIYMVLRSSAVAAQKSAEEEVKREIVREIVRKRRIDELYGRGGDDEGR